MIAVQFPPNFCARIPEADHTGSKDATVPFLVASFHYTIASPCHTTGLFSVDDVDWPLTVSRASRTPFLPPK
jgi:hypothetical protein